MSDNTLVPAQKPQQALSEPSDDRNPLIPLPTAEPAQTWLETAQRIADRYKATTPQTFPHCGRPSAITDVNAIAHLLDAVSDGLTPAQAANAIGFHPTTLSRWMQRADAEPESAHSMLRSALQMASDRRRRRLLASIEAAGHKGPQFWPALAWSAERTYGNDYKLAQDKTGGNVVIQIGIKDSEVSANIGVTDADLRLP